jgi:acetolactate synthase I/II/III large subunit
MGLVMRAANLIVKSLEAHGIERVYCVPGESYLALLDALHDSTIKVIVCRHEGGAGFMACAEAKLTGKPAVFLASRGPGATNASIAIHMAEQDALPVILMLGQVSREERTRGVFQEMDYTSVFGSLAKGVYEISDAQKLVELMPRALHLAQKGTPGPVVFSLPEDMLRDELGDAEAHVYPLPYIGHNAAAITDIQQLIDKAERPIVIAGAALRGERGATALAKFAEAQRIPVATSWKSQDVFDNASPLYAGHFGPGSAKAYRDMLSESDLILAFGTRLGDFATLSYQFPEAPAPKQTLVHVYADHGPLGHVFHTDFPLCADPANVLRDLAQTARVVPSGREAWNRKINAYIKATQTFTARAVDDGVDFGLVTEALSRLAPKDCIITMDAGNMTTWAHRHWIMSPSNTLLGCVVGAMGMGVPAAVAASIAQPHRMAICLVGDGGVLMTGQELATAVAYGASPKIVISDNGIYGTIRSHQEREYPSRISGTNLVNPDFTAWAKSFGVAAHRLDMGGDVDATVKAFLAEPGAAVLHVKSSAKSLSANGTLPT